MFGEFLKELKLQNQSSMLISSFFFFSFFFLLSFPFFHFVVQDQCRLFISLFYLSDISFIRTLRHLVLQCVERILAGSKSIDNMQWYIIMVTASLLASHASCLTGSKHVEGSTHLEACLFDLYF